MNWAFAWLAIFAILTMADKNEGRGFLWLLAALVIWIIFF